MPDSPTASASRDGGDHSETRLPPAGTTRWVAHRKAQVVEAISPNLYTISPEEQDNVVVTLEPLFQRLEAERRTLLGATLAELKGEES